MTHIPRRAATILAGTAVVTVLLFTFKTPAELLGGAGASTIAVVDDATAGAGSSSAPAATATPDTGSSGSSGGSSGAVAAPSPSAPTTSGGTTDVTEVTGTTVSTRFGPVQVKIVVSAGTVTDVIALQLPSGGRSGRISNAAEPMLHEQALAAQSASIDGVSGATYTSRAYAQSLQAALDQAGI